MIDELDIEAPEVREEHAPDDLLRPEAVEKIDAAMAKRFVEGGAPAGQHAYIPFRPPGG